MWSVGYIASGRQPINSLKCKPDTLCNDSCGTDQTTKKSGILKKSYTLLGVRSSISCRREFRRLRKITTGSRLELMLTAG